MRSAAALCLIMWPMSCRRLRFDHLLLWETFLLFAFESRLNKKPEQASVLHHVHTLLLCFFNKKSQQSFCCPYRPGARTPVLVQVSSVIRGSVGPVLLTLHMSPCYWHLMSSCSWSLEPELTGPALASWTTQSWIFIQKARGLIPTWIPNPTFKTGELVRLGQGDSFCFKIFESGF